MSDIDPTTRSGRASTRLLRGAAAAVPLLWVPVALLHPVETPYTGVADGNAGRWLAVHFAQLALAPLLALAVWAVLGSVKGIAGTVAKVAVTLWLATFSAFDAIAGIGTGRLSQYADGADDQAGDAVGQAVTYLFNEDPLVGGGLSVLALLTISLWLVTATSTAIALQAAGHGTATVIAAGLSALFAAHGGPVAVVGLVAIAVTAASVLSPSRSSVAVYAGQGGPALDGRDE